MDNRGGRERRGRNVRAMDGRTCTQYSGSSVVCQRYGRLEKANFFGLREGFRLKHRETILRKRNELSETSNE